MGVLRAILKFFGFVFAWASLGGVLGIAGIWGVVVLYSRDLPDPATLAAYEPATLTRVYSGDGALLDEFVRERRIFTPIDEIPELVKHAVISAEDKNFYNHPGFDIRGIAAAVWDAVNGQDLRGASTITQQVMKNFLLSGERSGERKIKEIILAVRLERTLTKDQILELYLNEPFLGQNSYGVAAAALTYFAKTLEELTAGEAAYLASLPKAPSELHPVRQREKALARRDYVLREMVQNGYLDAATAAAEEAKPLLTVQGGEIESARRAQPPRDYFTDEIRRQTAVRMGEDKVFGGGLSIRATIDPALQEVAAAALRRQLEGWDRSHGKYRGPVARIEPAALADEASWRAALAAAEVPRDIAGWYPAVVLTVEKAGARVGIEGVEAVAGGHLLPLKDASWTQRKKAEDLWAPGDVVYVAAQTDKKGAFTGWSLRQIPELQGAIMAMDPATGRVLALHGGFSYQFSVFNRATQATRQPGSSFKPFIYAAALDRGFSPETLVPDIPVTIDTGSGQLWRPRNSSGNFLGFVPMRTALALSRNLVTVRLAQELGMDTVAEYAERFGVYDDMPEHLAYALGAGETTLWRMVSAYGMLANGGLRIAPTLVDRIQDRRGRTVYRHDDRRCEGCAATEFQGQPEPWLVPSAERVLSAFTAYELTAMLVGVVRHGTASRAFAGFDLDLAGKTGTTNESKDVWFLGFTPNLVVGCYVGYDTPRPMGRGATGGELCAPAVRAVFAYAKETMPVIAFRRPEGGVLVKLDAETGERLPDDATGPQVVSRLFHAGEEPAIGERIVEITLTADDADFGDDLPFALTEDEAGTLAAVDPGGTAPPPPPPARQLDLGSGGLY